MALSFLFRRNAELCTKMARVANSVEMREQWTDLAKQWQKKAEADELQSKNVSGAEPLPRPVLASVHVDISFEKEQVARMATSAPALVPIQAEVTAKIEEFSIELAPRPLSEPAGDVAAPDEVWSRLIGDIQTKHHR